MSDIKQVIPLTRIQPVTKDRKRSSRQGNQEESNKKNDDKRHSRDQPGGSSHVDEYV